MDKKLRWQKRYNGFWRNSIRIKTFRRLQVNKYACILTSDTQENEAIEVQLAISPIEPGKCNGKSGKRDGSLSLNKVKSQDSGRLE